MLCHQLRRAVAVARVHRLRDRAVIGRVLRLPARFRAALRQQLAADIHGPERLERAHDLGVACCVRQPDVEVAAHVVGDPGGGRALLGVHDVHERVDVRGSPAFGRQARDPGLQDAAHLEAPHDLVEAERRDEEPAIGLELDDELSGKPVERFAYRCARDAECICQLALSESRTGLQLAVLDHRANALIGEIDDGVGLDSLDLSHLHDVQYSERNES